MGCNIDSVDAWCTYTPPQPLVRCSNVKKQKILHTTYTHSHRVDEGSEWTDFVSPIWFIICFSTIYTVKQRLQAHPTDEIWKMCGCSPFCVYTVNSSVLNICTETSTHWFIWCVLFWGLIWYSTAISFQAVSFHFIYSTFFYASNALGIYISLLIKVGQCVIRHYVDHTNYISIDGDLLIDYIEAQRFDCSYISSCCVLSIWIVFACGILLDKLQWLSWYSRSIH